MLGIQNFSRRKLLLQLGEVLCDPEFQCHKKVSRFAAVVNQSLDAKSLFTYLFIYSFIYFFIFLFIVYSQLGIVKSYIII